MLYIDYHFDLNDNIIILDKELRLKSQSNESCWGSLPSSWKEGDMFKLVVGANGHVTLIKVSG